MDQLNSPPVSWVPAAARGFRSCQQSLGQGLQIGSSLAFDVEKKDFVAPKPKKEATKNTGSDDVSFTFFTAYMQLGLYKCGKVCFPC